MNWLINYWLQIYVSEVKFRKKKYLNSSENLLRLHAQNAYRDMSACDIRNLCNRYKVKLWSQRIWYVDNLFTKIDQSEKCNWKERAIVYNF